MSPDADPRSPLSRIARGVSLLLALAISGTLFLYPRILGAEVEGSRHGLIAITMLGVCAGFVHGVGFVPRSGVWKTVFGPLCAWPIMVVGTIAVIMS